MSIASGTPQNRHITPQAWKIGLQRIALESMGILSRELLLATLLILQSCLLTLEGQELEMGFPAQLLSLLFLLILPAGLLSSHGEVSGND